MHLWYPIKGQILFYNWYRMIFTQKPVDVLFRLNHYCAELVMIVVECCFLGRLTVHSFLYYWVLQYIL